MAEFNLADVLRDVSAQDLGQEGREKLVYLDIDQIDDDPKNFYDLSNVEELANNIELIGQQQPARVRVHPDNPERYMIVSGHRRRAARRILVQEGKEQFRLMPCIIEQPAGSEALQELRLIYANSDTRRMTAAEISRQAERVEMLLYELKEQGMEFPGRMRDHVAEACKVSKSKLARLKVIRDQLIPELMEMFEAGNLSEDAAYTAAREEEQIQRYMFFAARKGRTAAWQLKYVRDAAVREKTGSCKMRTGPCDQFDVRMRVYLKDQRYLTCYGKCCADCSDLARCKFSCGICIDQKEAAAAKEAAESKRIREEAAARRAEEERIAADIAEKRAEKRAEAKKQGAIHWRRVGERRKAIGLTAEEVYNGFLDFCADEEDLEAIEQMENGDDVAEEIYWDSPLEDLGPSCLCFIADQLQCSTDYLLGRADTPQPAATLESAAEWFSYEASEEMLEEGDEALVLHRMTPGGPLLARIGVLRGHIFREREYGLPITGAVAWQYYHDPDLDVPDSGTDEESEENDD